MDVGTIENAQQTRARRRRLADTPTPAASSELTPSREAIQARAYELFLERAANTAATWMTGFAPNRSSHPLSRRRKKTTDPDTFDRPR